MNIAIVTPEMNAYSETFIKMQIEKLPAKIVFHDSYPPKSAGDRCIFKPTFFQRSVNRLGKLIGQEFYSYDKNISKILLADKIDAILAQYGPVAVSMVDICIKNKIPLFVHFHGYDAYIKEIIKTYNKDYKRLFEYASGVVAVSSDMRKQLIKLGCPEEKIKTFPCAPNNKFASNIPKYLHNNFLSVGRFVDKKAPYLTILAFQKVVAVYPDAILKMVGDGILLNSSKNIVKALHLEKNIKFLGAIKAEYIKNEMENALAYIQHSVTADNGDSEGTPVAVLEASLASLPVVATIHAGIKDVVIHDKTGLLSEENDIDTMAKNIIFFIEHKNKAKEYGEAGNGYINNNFSENIYIEKLKNMMSNF